MRQAALTPAEYSHELQLLSREIEEAIIIFYTYEDLNRLALHDEGCLSVLGGILPETASFGRGSALAALIS
jgi:hypothetical protein